MTDTLQGMTWETWRDMPEHKRAKLRDLSDLTPELIGLEGRRVEVVDKWGEKRRFYVGRSSGWKPIHIEVKRIDSTGGIGVMGAPFKSIRVLNKRRY